MKIKSCKKEILHPYSFRTPIKFSTVSNTRFPNGKFELPFSFSNQTLYPTNLEKNSTNKIDFAATSPSHSIFQCLHVSSKYLSESNSKSKYDIANGKKSDTNSLFNITSYKKLKSKKKINYKHQINDLNSNFVLNQRENNKTQFNSEIKWPNEKDNLKLCSVQALYPLICSKNCNISSIKSQLNNKNSLEFQRDETKRLLENLKQNNMNHEEFSKILCTDLNSMKTKLNETSKQSFNQENYNKIKFPLNQDLEKRYTKKYLPKNISILYQNSIKSKLSFTIKNWMDKLKCLKQTFQQNENTKVQSDYNDFGNFINYKKMLKKN